MCKLKEEDTLLVFVKVTFLKGLAHTDLAKNNNTIFFS